MMPAARTNEPPGTRAQVRHVRMSAYKAREVLDLIRGLPVGEAADVLQFTERAASVVIAKALASAVANAQHNDELDGDSLYVSACYADEGPTLKRWRPRARGRATRIRKRMCHITIVVSVMPSEMAAKVEAKQAAGAAAPSRRGRRAQESRRARVARSRGEQAAPEETPADETPTDETPTDEVTETPTDEVVDEPTDEVVEDEPTDETTNEAPVEEEGTEERGVESAGGGSAEGAASTKAEDEAK
jgi:large subunit ribosomal protein L22